LWGKEKREHIKREEEKKKKKQDRAGEKCAPITHT
jgi:hypothetical protein